LHRQSSQFGVSINKPLEDSADVSQVEGIVRLVGSGLQRAIEYIVIDPQGHLYQGVQTVLYICGEVVQEGCNNSVEYGMD
jgi:hypothetical protein